VRVHLAALLSPRAWPLSSAAAALLLTLAGCSDCGGSHAVPFRADAGPALVAAPVPPPAAPAFVPFDGVTLPESTRQVGVEGAPIAVTAGALRAALPVDLDADGDRDALVVTTDPAGSPTLGATIRDGATFAPARTLGALPLPAGCALDGATMRAVSATYATVIVTPRCPPSGAVPAPPAPPGAPPVAQANVPGIAVAAVALVAAEPITFVISLGTEPRIRERAQALPEAGRAPGVVTIAVRIEDRDADGSDDVVFDVDVTPPGATAAARVSLPWLERPSGLARDTHEPEAQLAERAARARRALRRNPDDALRLAREVLALHSALCREPGLARVAFGGSEGVPCRSSAAAGAAASIATQALAKQGELLAALDAWASLDRPGATVTRADREAALRAMDALPAEAGATWRVGPTHAYRGGPDARLSALAFTPGGDALLLRGGPAASSWSVADGAVSAAPPEAGDILLRDPSRQLAIVDVHRTCRGFVLGIVHTANVVEGVVVGRYLAEPLIAAAPPPQGARCSGADGTLPEASRLDAGGYAVLGWAPQGAVVARGAEVRVVPLDANGAAIGEASLLAEGTPAPAPFTAGAATPDGSAYAFATPFGVVLRELVPRARVVLLRPEGWATAQGTAGDVAVSSDARRVAVEKGGVVYLISRAGG
jgi:hypothetical protein